MLPILAASADRSVFFSIQWIGMWV